MSSSIDAGYYAEQREKESNKKCKKSPTKKHVPVIACGSPPSAEYKCKHCGKPLGYSK